jgi:hypothetical protein
MPKTKQSCCCEEEKQEKSACGCSGKEADDTGSCCSETRNPKPATQRIDVDSVDCSCGGTQKEITKFKKVRAIDMLKTPPGAVPVVSTSLSAADTLGNLLARLGINRMAHAVKPGLYAAGRPDMNSPVLVSANYKMSFDALRRELAGIDAWILVLDTKGVNVWCAAGKGTFGTEEIINRVKSVKLYKIVTHRNLIVPQLGAPGVGAHIVRKRTGFKVNYGPVEARDIKAFLEKGMKADEKQRTVEFGLLKRLEVTGIEFMTAVKIILAVSFAAVLAAGFTKQGFSIAAGFASASYFIEALLLAALASTVIPAALLPVLPGRMFSIKGALAGFLISLVFVLLAPGMTRLTQASIVLLSTSLASFVFMNYTGTTTFTSLTGVRREIAVSVPFMIAGAVLGMGLQIADFFIKGAIKWN